MNVIMSVKLKNAINKAYGKPLEFKLSNISVNGDKRGCSGFVKNPENGVVVYVNTEKSVLKSLGYLVRYARDFKDYTGTRNRNDHFSLEDIVEEVCEMLNREEEWKRELVAWKR